MKNLQVFVHRYYDGLKLFLLIILVIMSLFIILKQLAENNSRAEGRTRAVSEVVTAVQEENKKQTEIINRQFTALCILIFETSGQEGLNKLDPETRARCENLAEPTSQTSEESKGEQGSPQQTSQSSSSAQPSKGNNTPQNNNTQPNNSQANPQEPPQPSVVDPGYIQCVSGQRTIIGLITGPVRCL